MNPSRLSAPLWLAVALTACVSTPDLNTTPVAAAAEPHFNPFVFFNGRLVGDGRLNKALSATVPTRVESRGTVSGGVLHLVQQVRMANEKPRTREWIIREVGPDRYTGTLTDAEGPVNGEVVGNQLHLSFVMKKGGLPTDQWLNLSPDGRRAYNVLKVRKFGLNVAALTEDIRKID